MTAGARRNVIDEYLMRVHGADACVGSSKETVERVRDFFDSADPVASDRSADAQEDKAHDLFDAIARSNVGRAKTLLRSGHDCVRWMVFGRASVVTGNTPVHSTREARERARERGEATVDAGVRSNASGDDGRLTRDRKSVV